LFYYLYGTVNYANAVLTKLMINESESESVHKSCIQTQEKWLKTIQQIKQTLLNHKVEDFDTSGYRVLYRVKQFLKLKYRDEKLVVVTDSETFKLIIQYSLKEHFPWIKDVKILSPVEGLSYEGITEYFIYYLNDMNNVDKKGWKKGQKNTLAIITDINESKGLEDDISFMYIPTLNSQTTLINELMTTTIALECCLSDHKSSLIFPKFHISDDASISEANLDVPIDKYAVYEYPNYLCIYPHDTTPQDILVPNSGSRGKVLLDKLKMSHLILRILTKEWISETQKSHSSIIQRITKNQSG
jgi:hypothetical protein